LAAKTANRILAAQSGGGVDVVFSLLRVWWLCSPLATSHTQFRKLPPVILIFYLHIWGTPCRAPVLDL
jgi:hypothetical protein